MRKVLLTVCVALAAVAVSAQEKLVLNEKALPAGHKMLVVKDVQGRIMRQLVKPAAYAKAAKAQAPAKDAGDLANITFYEGFENYREAYGMNWIPADWTKINTPENVPTEEQLSHSINNSWYVYLSSNMFQDMTTDGEKEAFIHFGYSDPDNGLNNDAQDEWLVTPEITLQNNETLHFLLQADFFDVYDCDDFDWSALTYPQPRVVVNTMKVMLTEDDGANWTELWDLATNVADKMTDRECYDNSDLHIRRMQTDLSAYAGKNVKLAFRYVRKGNGWYGNSMILDSVTVSHPSPAGIESVKGNGTQTGLTEYFTADGTRLSATRPSAKGLYIERKNGVVRKVAVK